MASPVAGGGPVTGIAEAPRELLAFVCAMRGDWTEDETMTAIGRRRPSMARA